MTATAPLCNQGIYSCFYPASESFVLAVWPTQKPSQLAASASPSPGGQGRRAAGASAGEESDEPFLGATVSIQAPGASLLPPPVHSGSPFPETQEGQGKALREFRGCSLYSPWGRRAVPALNRAMGAWDLGHGRHSLGTELSSALSRPWRSWAGRLLPLSSGGVSMGLTRLMTFALCLLAERINLLGTGALKVWAWGRGSPWVSGRPQGPGRCYFILSQGTEAEAQAGSSQIIPSRLRAVFSLPVNWGEAVCSEDLLLFL